MRYFVCLLLMLPATLLAQKTDGFRNSIGVFGETNAYFAWGNEMNTMGIQYIKKSGKWLSYKVSLGYSTYAYEPEYSWIRDIKNDTMTEWGTSAYAKLGILGLGIEAQRQFYKKLHFFAGFEMRAGYGSGITDTHRVKHFKEISQDPFTGNTEERIGGESTNWAGPPTTMLHVGFSPYIGLKLEFNRISFGASLLNYWSYVSANTREGTMYGGVLDFDVANITQNFFVRYKF